MKTYEGDGMKFEIYRTSNSDDKPCKEARRMSVPYWHTRTCTEGEFNKRFSDSEGLWRSKGRNHKTVHAGQWITRQEKNNRTWGIEIVSLAEFLMLSEKYGQLIFVGGKMPEIEIYDDYRHNSTTGDEYEDRP